MSLGNNVNDAAASENIKAADVFDNYETLFVKFQELLKKDQKPPTNATLKTFHPNGRSLRDVREDIGPFVWSHSYTVLLTYMPCNTRGAKKQMIAECRKHPAYYNNAAQLAKVSKFERDYCPQDATRWYTQESFIHTVINEALRTEDPWLLYIYRFYIMDLCKRLEDATLVTKVHQKSPFCVYRGATIDRCEVEKLRIGMLVGTNGFFSSSLRPEVAKMFISIDPATGVPDCRHLVDGQELVLFEIDVDLNQTSGLIVADVSAESNYPEEKEILFGLGTTFVITKIIHDDQHNVWYVGMIVSSEMCELKQEYTQQVEKSLTYSDPTTLFGIYLSEMSSDYSSGLKHFHRYLRQMRFDDPNRAGVYYCTARVYRLMSKYQHAIEYFRRAMLLRKRSSLQFSYVYADTLSDLAATYSQLNDTSKAIRLHEQAVAIFRRILGKNDADMPLYYTQLAYAYWQAKRYEDAHDLLLAALAIHKEDKRSNFSGISITKHTMGLVKYALNQREDAIRFLQEALELRRQLFANDHPSVAHSYYALARVYMETGDEQIALEYAQTALTIYQAKLSANHIALKDATELVERLRSL